MSERTTFGLWLKQRRKALDLTQEELANLVGCSVINIRKIEADERRPSKQVAELLAQPLEISGDELELFIRFARGQSSIEPAIIRPQLEQIPIATSSSTPTNSRLVQNQVRPYNADIAEQRGIDDNPSVPDHKQVPSLPTGIVTFLFTDIEGSTTLWETIPDEMKASLAQHHAILRNAIETNEGYVFQVIGDAFQAAFRLASSALKAALDAQYALRKAVWGVTGPLHVRMGIHTGPAEIDRQGNAPYEVSHTLNRAARIMSAANGGQILLSQEMTNLIIRELPKNVTLREMGNIRVKGMQRLEQVFQVIAEGLRDSYPPITGLTSRSNLMPEQLTRFIGRENEILKITNLLHENRLVTLTGSGGVGKTRLSKKVAAELQDSYHDGIWWVDLSPLTDGNLLPLTVASAFGLQEDAMRPIREVLRSFLYSRHLLLILDNCEHLIEASSQFIKELIETCPQITILATSREALNIDGEMRFRVPSLTFPLETSEYELSIFHGYEAVRLFVDRAIAANPDFSLSENDIESVAQIIQRLDGIPLALELAAARLNVLTTDQLAKRLNDAFGLLTTTYRTTLPRQQTLKATIDWSYQLLSEKERVIFHRMSIFKGGFTLEAVESICGYGVIEREEVLDLIASLVNKSILVTDYTVPGIRYRMLETVRQYAHEKCLEQEDSNHLHNRHATYFVEFAEEAEPNLFIFDNIRKEWFKRVNADLDNLRAAVDWSFSKNEGGSIGLRIATAIGRRYMQSKGLLSECHDWLLTGINRLDKEPKQEILLARAYNVLGYLALHLADWQLGIQSHESSIAICEKVGSIAKAELSWALWGAGFCIACGGFDLDHARQLMDKSVFVARQLGSSRVEQNYLLNALAYKARLYGYFFPERDLTITKQLAEECVILCQRIGANWYSGAGTWILGLIAGRQGDFELAQRYLDDALESFSLAEDWAGVANSYRYLSWLAHRKNDFTNALTYIQQYIKIWHRFGNQNRVIRGVVDAGIFIASHELCNQKQANLLVDAIVLFSSVNRILEGKEIPVFPEENDNYNEVYDQVKSKMSEEMFSSAWIEGQRMNLYEVVDRVYSIKVE